MSVTAIRTAPLSTTGTAPYQTAVRDLAANEFVFGVAGPVGSGTSEVAEALEGLLLQAGYETAILKARDVIAEVAANAGLQIPSQPALEQARALQDAGDKIRQGSSDNAAVAVGLIGKIRLKRAKKSGATTESGEAVQPDGTKRAFILDSLRHPHEVALLRRVYQDAFCLIGVFCYTDERVKRLSEGKYSAASRDEIGQFMDRDENAPEAYGQKVGDTFHLADYFVDNSLPRFKKMVAGTEENPEWDVPDQLGRLIDILTHRKIVRPRPGEVGMFHAHGAKMRSSCLSRQVGASLLDGNGTLIATGTNEVPRAGGGVYGAALLDSGAGDPDRHGDFRCFVHHGFCSNTRACRQLSQNSAQTS